MFLFKKMLRVFPQKELCIFYLFQQMKTKYLTRKGQEKLARDQMQCSLTVPESSEGRGVAELETNHSFNSRHLLWNHNPIISHNSGFPKTDRTTIPVLIWMLSHSLVSFQTRRHQWMSPLGHQYSIADTGANSEKEQHLTSQTPWK